MIEDDARGKSCSPLTELDRSEHTSDHEADTCESERPIERFPPRFVPLRFIVPVPASQILVPTFQPLTLERERAYTRTMNKIHMPLNKAKLAI